jgi:hypothetical protein
MKIQPTQTFLLVRMHEMNDTKKLVALPDNNSIVVPYGEVISVGPDCKSKPGDFVPFLPSNMIAGFDQHNDPKFIVPESAVFGYYIPEVKS